ncbi:MAG TPA: MerR family transcriptional regulator [Polyangiaceae bacterium]|nr:MerR family transcriptional regulator [Polyangiaceae bacterium]
MSEDQLSDIPVKLYYRIGEVSQIVGVEPHVLRYWESEFRSIRPQKSRKGQRIYSRRDVDKLLKVKDLLYTHGFTIAGARKRLRDPAPELEPTVATVVAPLPVAAPEPQARRVRPLLHDLRSEVCAMLVELEAAAAARG